MSDEFDPEDEIRYPFWDALDFSIITMGMKKLPFFEDDLWLGMQGMNIGIVDSVITEYEYDLLREYNEIEKTPLESALAVTAMSQMWIFGLYEVFRLWRDRQFQFNKLLDTGGINPKLENLPDDDPQNLTLGIRRRQLERFRDDAAYRGEIEATWQKLEPIYRMVELFRMNLAKHCAPGKDGLLPRAPGYGRINCWCGAMDFELIDKEGYYHYMNRRDIADTLRKVLTLV
ncbi:MAG TPA: hypothetical protein PLQ95_02775 [Thiobacillus sp.]|nr:hypothetical protein [Thiobacillus sp.]